MFTKCCKFMFLTLWSLISLPVNSYAEITSGPQPTSDAIPCLSKYSVIELTEVNPTGSVEGNTFQWKFNGNTYKWTVKVPAALLSYDRSVKNTIQSCYEADPVTQQEMLTGMTTHMKAMTLCISAAQQGNLTPMLNDTDNNSYISILASILKQQAQKEGYDVVDTAEFVLSFVQAIPYVFDEYPQLPVQTIIDSGDCDAKSILLCSILKAMGYQTAEIYYSPQALDNSIGHLMAGIALNDSDVANHNGTMKHIDYQGLDYYLAETTKVKDLGEEIGYTHTCIYPVE